MKVLFPINENRIDGPENWRRELVNQLKKDETIILLGNENFFSKIMKVISSDVIHSYTQSPQTIFSILIGKIFHKRIIHTVHGNYYEEQKNKKGIKKYLWMPFNKICVNLADKVTFPSKYLMKKIEFKSPFIKNKSIIVPNGINLQEIKKVKEYTKKELGLKKDDFLIVEVTNFNHKKKAKGIDLLIKDFEKLKNKKNNSFLFILGAGKLLEKYKQRYASNNIHFLGFRNDVRRYIKSCDLFVHYSLLDNFPIVLLEAMAYKKKIIALPTGGIPEFVPKENLILNKNKEIVYQKINSKYTQIEKYSIDHITKEFEEIYKGEK
ncbi:glycosyltransferase family 4 protein [Candidatus Pacearchaeota archaeon]|nr:glycosyltransferase family 4 protein [Candidatus Pacearchaeota archaeon]